MKLHNRLQQLEKARKRTQGAAAMKFLAVQTYDDINFYELSKTERIDITTLDPANLPEGVTHYTESELENLPEGTHALIVSYASAAERKAAILAKAAEAQ